MDRKKTCLSTRLVPVCMFSLILLTISLVAWLIPLTPIVASHVIVSSPIDTGANAPADTTHTTDIAVSGSVIYITVKGTWGSSPEFQSRVLLKSTDGGMTWSDLTPALESSLQDTLTNTDLVAAALDDPNIVVVIDKTTFSAGLSTNGGSTWQNLGLEYAEPPLTEINDIDISPMASSGRYVAIAGVANGVGTIYYYNLSSAMPSWGNVFGLPFTPPNDAFWAVKFSPNFAADQSMLAVSYENTQGVRLNVASFNTHLWNSNVEVTFPRKMEITSAPGPLTFTSADIVLDQEFFMGDVATQIGFIGVWVRDNNSAEIGGVYRIGTYTSSNSTYSMTQILDHIPINSVAWDGTNLLASGNHNITFYRINNALSPSPTIIPTPGNNAPPGREITFLTFCGPDIIAATLCPDGGISRSTDAGTTFQMVLPYCLASPVLEYPPNESIGIEPSPTFSWQPVPYASFYELQVATDPAFTGPIVDTTLSQTAFPLDLDLAAETGYYWRVRSLSGIASSAWSTSVFIVNTPQITLFPDNGEPDTSVAVTGTGFPPDADAIIWFDSNGNAAFDPGEPTQSFITTSDGGFPDGISLTVPSLPADTYQILAYVPYVLTDNVIEASAEFDITESAIAVGPIVGGVVAVGVAAAAVAARTPIKKWWNKKNMEKTKTEFKKAGIEIKISNTSGTFQISQGTLLQTNNAIRVRLVLDPGRHSIKAKKPLVGGGKEAR